MQKNKKYLHISQNWGMKVQGLDSDGSYKFMNPVSDKKGKLTAMADLRALSAFLSDSLIYRINSSPFPDFGEEVYEIIDEELIFVSADYDTSG